MARGDTVGELYNSMGEPAPSGGGGGPMTIPTSAGDTYFVIGSDSQYDPNAIVTSIDLVAGDQQCAG